jgi:hypothetical protein
MGMMINNTEIDKTDHVNDLVLDACRKFHDAQHQAITFGYRGRLELLKKAFSLVSEASRILEMAKDLHR